METALLGRLISAPDPDFSDILKVRAVDLSGHELRANIIEARLWELMRERRPNVTEFILGQIAFLEAELDFLRSYRDGLQESRIAGTTDREMFVSEIENIARNGQYHVKAMRLLKGREQRIKDDIEREMERLRRSNRNLENETGIKATFLGRAYTNTLKKVRAFDDFERKADPDTSRKREAEFRHMVIKHYDAAEERGDYTWCHILGKWVVSHRVGAVQFVPDGLPREELAYLFGDEKLYTFDSGNGLTVMSAIKWYLDRHIIAIVPMPGGSGGWQCLLLDDGKREEIIWKAAPPEHNGVDSDVIRLKDIDGRALSFRSDKHPAPCFIFFHFMVSCMHASVERYEGFINKLKNPQIWPTASPERYLERMTLDLLTRCVAGCAPPLWLLDGKTFSAHPDRQDRDYRNRAGDAGMILALELRQMRADRMKEDFLEETRRHNCDQW
ncbi:hypothetical protein BDV10DRAFT_181169 [Aspergillus recurvatus]